jgi:hypothetical protein
VIATAFIDDLGGWLLLPILAYLVFTGIGLLVERLARSPLPNGLLAPLGLCVAVVAVLPGYELGAGAWLAIAILAVLAVAGLGWNGRELPARLNPGWAGVAALAVYLLYIGPFVVSGDSTWGGYNLVNDTSVHLVLSDYIAQYGAVASQPGDVSTYLDTALEYVDGTYPIGAHGLLATFSRMVPGDVATIYQPMIAVLAALAAMALATIGRRAGISAPAAAVAGFVAVSGTLAFQHGLHGSIKEIGLVATLALTAALGRELLLSRRPIGLMVAFAIAVAAGYALLSAPGLAYGLVIAASLLVATYYQHDSRLRPELKRVAIVGAVVLGLAAIPALIGLSSFLETASGVFVKADDIQSLGHLARPLLVTQAAGVWLGPYRVAVADGLPEVATALLVSLVTVLLLLGAFMFVRRRESAPLLLLASAAAVYVVVELVASPYASSKALVVLSVAVLFLAACGAAFVAMRWRVLGAGLMVVLVAGVLWSDSYGYRHLNLAPVDRMASLTSILDELPPDASVLVNEREEFGKYFARNRNTVFTIESFTPLQIKAELLTVRLPDIESAALRNFDLDEQRISVPERFEYVVQRRSPAASRPPANFELVAQNEYYEAWRRMSRPEVVAHLPIGSIHASADVPPCDAVRRFARRASPGDRLVAARPAPAVSFNTASAGDLPPEWIPDATDPEVLRMLTPGTAGGEIEFPETGTYEIWVRGSFGRPVDVLLDGKVVATVEGINSSRQWLSGGIIEAVWLLARARPLRRVVAADRHAVAVQREGRRLAPGDLADSIIGPVTFQRNLPEGLVTVRPGQARRLCGQAWDWIEIVRGRNR